MNEPLVPFEVLDLKKSEFIWVQEDLFRKADAVVLLPIEGEVKRTETGWVQILNGKAAVQFGVNEVVWRAKEST